MTAVVKWSGYLVGSKFVIRTDHASLKYLREQKITNSLQQKWLYKIMGFDFTIEYKQGKSNLVADALSRKWEYMEDKEKGEGNDTTLCTITTQVQPAWVADILLGYEGDKVCTELLASCMVKGVPTEGYTIVGGILKYKSRIMVGTNGGIRLQILKTIHETAIVGHSGIHTSYLRAKGLFYWKGLKADIEAFIQSCGVCKMCKDESVATPGLLQPLPIPNGPWAHISMDFIEGLPKSTVKEVIWVIIDRLTKYAHFIPFPTPALLKF